MEDKNKSIFDSIQFPIVRNFHPRTIGMDLESIPSSEMPRRMGEMFKDASKHMRNTINKELDEIRGVEGKEERVKYLEELLNSPLANMDKK
jgi:hypothetical protein